MAEKRNTDIEPKAPEKIALISRTGQVRNRGGYHVPADAPLVLEIDSIDPRDLKALESDPHILRVRTDSPLTENPARFDNTDEREHYGK